MGTHTTITATAMDEFLVRAALAGLVVALAAGPCGCFVVWRRLAYFGDTLAHGALLGVAAGTLLQVDLTLGVLVAAVAIALALTALERQRRIPSDSLLGILAHASLAIAIVAIALADGPRVDLHALLFGDLLAVGWGDLAWIAAGAGVSLAGLALLWRPLLAITVSQELARVDGVRVEPVRVAFVILLAILAAIAMRVVGALVVTALLILPAASARFLAGTPERMAALATLLAVIAMAGGLAASLVLDTPPGPSAVVVAFLIFLPLAAFARRDAA